MNQSVVYTFITESTDYYFHKLKDLVKFVLLALEKGEIFMSLANIDPTDCDDFEIIKNIGRIKLKIN